MKRSQERPNQEKLFMEKWLRYLNNQHNNENYKTWKERKEKKPTCWSVHLFCFV
jgi:hypothetical protein